MKPQVWIGWILCALLAACASQPKQPPRIAMQGFSFVLPGEKEWVVATRSPALTALGRAGRFSGQALTIAATVIDLPPAASSVELVRYVEALQRKALDPGRYKVFTLEVSQQVVQGQSCAVSRIEMAERTTTAGTGSPVNMRVETLTLVCPHPKDPSRGINLAYSHRHFPEDLDPQFWQDAAVRVQSLAFEPL